MWSNRAVNFTVSPGGTVTRIGTHRCRLVRRGIGAGPLYVSILLLLLLVITITTIISVTTVITITTIILQTLLKSK